MTFGEAAAPFGISPEIFLLIALWSLLWKAASLWVSARSNDKWWFIVLLIFSTLGILDSIYLFWIKKGKWPKEVKIDRVP